MGRRNNQLCRTVGAGARYEYVTGWCSWYRSCRWVASPKSQKHWCLTSLQSRTLNLQALVRSRRCPRVNIPTSQGPICLKRLDMGVSAAGAGAGWIRGARAGPAFINRCLSEAKGHCTDVARHKSQGSYGNVPECPGVYSSSSSLPLPPAQAESCTAHYKRHTIPISLHNLSHKPAAATRLQWLHGWRILGRATARTLSIPSSATWHDAPASPKPAPTRSVRSVRRRCYERVQRRR